MKRLILLFCLACALFLSTLTANAHILKSDGMVGAVMHIDPEDDPIVGVPAAFYFDIKDKTGRYRLQNCACNFSIIHKEKVLFKTEMKDTTAPKYSFPAKGIYTVSVSGKPLHEGTFDAFTLSYDLRVAREGEPGEQIPQKKNHLLHVIVFSIPFLWGFYVTIKDSASKKKT